MFFFLYRSVFVCLIICIWLLLSRSLSLLLYLAIRMLCAWINSHAVFRRSSGPYYFNGSSAAAVLLLPLFFFFRTFYSRHSWFTHQCDLNKSFLCVISWSHLCMSMCMSSFLLLISVLLLLLFFFAEKTNGVYWISCSVRNIARELNDAVYSTNQAHK